MSVCPEKDSFLFKCDFLKNCFHLKLPCHPNHTKGTHLCREHIKQTENTTRGQIQFAYNSPGTWLLRDLERLWSSLESTGHRWVGALKPQWGGVSVCAGLCARAAVRVSAWGRGLRGAGSVDKRRAFTPESSGLRRLAAPGAWAWAHCHPPRGPAQRGRCPGQRLRFFIGNHWSPRPCLRSMPDVKAGPPVPFPGLLLRGLAPTGRRHCHRSTSAVSPRPEASLVSHKT